MLYLMYRVECLNSKNLVVLQHAVEEIVVSTRQLTSGQYKVAAA